MLFQRHLVEPSLSICSRNQHMVDVGFQLRITLKRPDLRRGHLLLARAQEDPQSNEARWSG